MSTGSDAERFAQLEEETDIRLRALHGNRDKGHTVEVPGVFEAISFVTWEAPDGGLPVYMRGPQGARGQQLGSLAVEGAAVLRQHPEAFRPLMLPVDFPAEDGGHGKEQRSAQGSRR